MNCPKCNSPLEVFSDGKKVFKLQYGKHYEPVYTCSGGCPGLWTETNMGLYQEMRKRQKRRREHILEEKPVEAYEQPAEET